MLLPLCIVSIGVEAIVVVAPTTPQYYKFTERTFKSNMAFDFEPCYYRKMFDLAVCGLMIHHYIIMIGPQEVLECNNTSWLNLGGHYEHFAKPSGENFF